MKADPEKAESIGSRLVLYKDSLAKQHLEVLDATKLQEILDATSHDTLATQQELIMAWRLYTQEREQQIAWGEFYFCSSPEEIEAARRFSRAKTIIFDAANLRGIERIRSEIRASIEKDVLSDSIKWQAVEAQDEKIRKEFGEANLQWVTNKAQAKFRRYYSNRIAGEIGIMLKEHRDYWAQRPTELYDDKELTHVFAFAFHGPNHGLGELFMAWDEYLEWRIFALDLGLRVPFARCTDEEKASAKEERRKLPIKWPHSHPHAREIVESHISAIVREDIVADTEKWERHKREVEDAKKRYQAHRLQRLEEHRNAFISKVCKMFGQRVLELISDEDVNRYSMGIVDRRESEEKLWYTILKKYHFDGNTNSCLYFIRQGNAIKIGITDELDRRFAQIKTSAALPCKIENAVYTHHGKTLERKLHHALADYRSHLEWFDLPSRIEKALFAAKTVEDIENVLSHVRGEESNDLFDQTTDA